MFRDFDHDNIPMFFFILHYVPNNITTCSQLYGLLGLKGINLWIRVNKTIELFTFSRIAVRIYSTIQNA